MGGNELGIFKMGKKKKKKPFLVSKGSVSEGSGLVGEGYSSLSVKNSIHPNNAPQEPVIFGYF